MLGARAHPNIPFLLIVLCLCLFFVYKHHGQNCAGVFFD